MAESTRTLLDQMEQSPEAVSPRLEAAGAAAAEQAANYRVAMERMQVALQAAAQVSDDDFHAVRLAVERVQAEVGRRTV